MKSIQQDHQDACYLADELGIDTKGLPPLFNEHHVIERYAIKIGMFYEPYMTLDELLAQVSRIKESTL